MLAAFVGQIGRVPGAAPNHDRRTHLTNRSAWLSLAAALSFFVGLLTVGTTLQKTEDVVARAASGTPFAIAVGSAVWARATRAKLRALGSDVEEPDPATRRP